MKAKNIILSMLILATTATAFTACSVDDDYPGIISYDNVAHPTTQSQPQTDSCHVQRVDNNEAITRSLEGIPADGTENLADPSEAPQE